MKIGLAELSRSIELYQLERKLRQQAIAGEVNIAFTKEPALRERSSVKRLVIAFGSYDPLSYAHELLFEQGIQVARQISGTDGIDELLIVTSVHHFNKQIDLKKNSTLYDRIHAQEGFASCFGNASLAYFNQPLFVTLAKTAKQKYVNAQCYFVMGTDVFEKIIDKKSYDSFGLNADAVLDELFEHRFIIANRATKDSVETAKDIIDKYNYAAKYSSNIFPTNLNANTRSLEVPIENVSSTLIRTKRTDHQPVKNLLAVGLSDFVDNRFLYLENNFIYAAIVAARELYATKFSDKPIGTYIDTLARDVDLIFEDKELAERIIKEYESINH
jgi:nicotinic acid mononucleotide adenylyltransferase